MAAGRGVKFWAWTASVGVHIVLLTGFAVVKVSESKAQSQHVSPTAMISRIQKVMESQPAIPKPKVKAEGERRVIARAGISASYGLMTSEIFTPAKAVEATLPDTAAPQEVLPPAPGNIVVQPSVEFFDSVSQARHVCFVVDCSGSMQGLLARVHRELIDSIAKLEQDQYFCIIGFGAGRLFESGNGSLVRATPRARDHSRQFIESLQSAGETNALSALERAMKVRDAAGNAPAVIYFLTDGFELAEDDAGRLVHRVSTLLKSFAPYAKINTIGFWPSGQDRLLLETIARDSGGQSTVVGDTDN